jgi:hypothetical protein
MTLNQIADTADVDFTTVRGHARGDFPAIRRTTATKILAVRPQQLSPTSRVNAVGTRRRLQALYADGHGPYLIARAHPSLNSRVLEYIVSGERAQVTVATRDAVADVYRTLAGQPGNSPTSRRTAAANNWPDADYWEDAGHIDDPDFDPDPDAAETPLSRNELAALRKADVEHLASYGIDEDEIAERVGLAKSTVHALVEEWRTGAKRDRRKQQVSA